MINEEWINKISEYFQYKRKKKKVIMSQKE